MAPARRPLHLPRDRADRLFVAGRGVSVDAVVADFISGATEWLTPENDPDHWDLVEGQGSLHHPSYAGVTLA